MADASESEAVSGDTVVSELLQVLGPRIKSVEVERTVSDSERRVIVRVETFGLENVGPTYFDEAAAIPPHGYRDAAAWRR